MSRIATPELSFDRIFHPTDFTHGSEVAFAHALRLGVAAKAELEIIHVERNGSEPEWNEYPGVRQTLARWGMLAEHAHRADVEKTGVRVYKTRTHGAHPAAALLRELERDPADLIVLATHGRDGLARWLHEETANKLARYPGFLTLLIPHGVKGFVSLRDGTVSLRRILLPVDNDPSPQLAVEAAAALARVLGCSPTDFDLLHVGPKEAVAPAVHLPEQSGWSWGRTHQLGDVVKEILAAAQSYAADLIVLATRGHDGFLDILRGSTTERILQAAPCPVLAIRA